MGAITAAVVGTGFMGHAHVEGLRRAGVPIAGIVGSSADKARQAAQSLGLPRGYASLAEALADPAVGSVHLVTPNKVHFEQVKQSLAAGKHVLCEKPLAMTLAECNELVRLARECPRQAAAVNYNIRFYPLCVEARERVRRGDLGRVLHVAGCYVQDWLLYQTDYNWRVLCDQGGALRAVADIGTHWLDLLQTVTGQEIEAVCADLVTVHPVRKRPLGEVETFTSAGSVQTVDVPINTDDYGAILLRFRGGARGAVWVSQVTAGRKNALRFEIAGSQQALAWESERPNELWIGQRSAANQMLLKDPSLASAPARAVMDYPGGHNEGYADTFKQCFRAFYSYIAAGDFKAPAPFASFEDGRREAALCEAVLESAQSGRWVTVG